MTLELPKTGRTVSLLYTVNHFYYYIHFHSRPFVCSFLGITKEMLALSCGRGDSENETIDITPDTDSENTDQIQRIRSSSDKHTGPSMGKRNLEIRNGKTVSQQKRGDTALNSTQQQVENTNTAVEHVRKHLPQQGVTVAALEVQNVKRAINRYGTLPKGARIGQYLESLKSSETDRAVSDLPPPPPLSCSR